ncbi:MAG: SLOG family protein [Christensenella sp.]|uniref:SLOG family protein n=1 Tax=Christensenella sp. TaxID=1935934 RepID=UPI002B21E38C|nr:SLOG family protein [Christensenella sp.]MEA5003018.1 SLOG family protein [Christensenella sp.]
MNKSHTCCFTGHRPHKLPFLRNEDHPQYRLLEQQLITNILKKALTDGCDTFLTGMAQGIDILCAELVLKIRELIGEHLRLVCAIPYLAQAQRWEATEQARYKKILAQADHKILLGSEYADGCLLARDRFLVEHSAHMIAVYDGASAGGTKYTLEYAYRKNLSVCEINPNRLMPFAK